MYPSPHRANWQFLRHIPSSEFCKPISHCSPVPGVTIPLPQPVHVQLLSQPSPSTRSPSSHSSLESTIPSPQPPASTQIPSRGAQTCPESQRSLVDSHRVVSVSKKQELSRTTITIPSRSSK